MRRPTHGTGAKAFGSSIAVAVALLIVAAPASAAPSWEIHSQTNPTAVPGEEIDYYLEVRASGDRASGEPIPVQVGGNDENCTPGAPAPADPSKCYRVTATLPEGITPVSALSVGFPNAEFGGACTVDAPSNTVTCETPGSDADEQVNPETGPARLAVGENGRRLSIKAMVSPTAAGTLTASFEASGGGAAPGAVVDTTRITPTLPEFGIAEFDAQMTADAQHNPHTQAGGVPYSATNDVEFNSYKNPDLPDLGIPVPFPLGTFWPIEPIKDVAVDLPPGLIGNPTAVGRCNVTQLAHTFEGGGTTYRYDNLCPPSSQVGVVWLRTGDNAILFGPALGPIPVYNMVPGSGSPARFGLKVLTTVVNIDARLRYESDYGITLGATDNPLTLAIQGVNFEFWGVPFDEAHRPQRLCPGLNGNHETCSTNAVPTPLLRQPTACTKAGEGLEWSMHADSWKDVGDFKEKRFESHDPPGYPAAPEDWGPPQGPTGCDSVPVRGELDAQPTAQDAETPTGLRVRVEVPNPGLENPSGIASSDLKRVEVSLPRGVTINPSQAEGLGVCSPAQYESTELSFSPSDGTGCPSDSKIGTVSVETPLLEETIPGDVFVAEPYENPFNSLLAIYIVLAEPQRGILVKLPGEVRTNERTGQVEAEFSDLPQVVFSTFDFKFREGARAPLATPPTCGTYETVSEIEGWSDPGNPITSTSSFQITRGVGGGPCPPGGVPGFQPGFSAGSINNNAGAHTPFNMRVTRRDGEQDMTRFSAVLPAGVLGKLAGVGRCPNSAIAAAKARTGPHGGQEEIANPSCPASSLIGRSIVGAGVGSVLTYVPGKVYLGGPVGSAPLSVIAITPVVAGPFDVGTVVVREALTLNPLTAEVEVDGSLSDPIPHILKGIPAKLRDLRVYVDRPEFILNPTSCHEDSTRATLFGGGGNPFSSADDIPVALSERFQAASCASLGFKPKLGLRLKGGTRRGGHPGLRAVYTPRKGDANIEGLVVRLPRSAFLDQAHIRTICTRVQYAAHNCPKGARYGYIRAWSPLLDEPLQGPVWLRSSNNKLPDMVFDLKGLVDVEVAVRIDSAKGGIRATMPSAPDAPLSRVVLNMQGGKKGLIINSRNLCTKRKARANLKSTGHNGKRSTRNPVMRAQCKRRKAKRGSHGRASRARVASASSVG